jgi:hypothetical protein
LIHNRLRGGVGLGGCAASLFKRIQILFFWVFDRIQGNRRSPFGGLFVPLFAA